MPQNDKDYYRMQTLKKLVQESMQFDLKESEALVYIAARYDKVYKTGKKKGKVMPISKTALYNYKKRVIEESGHIDARMFEHARAGFVKKHFETLDTAEALVKHLMGTIFVTHEPMQKAALAQQVGNFLYLIWQLNISSPVIDQIKQYIAEHLKSNPEPEKQEETIADDTGAQSAIHLPKGFIKSSRDAEDDRGGMAAGAEFADAVFEEPRKPKGQALLDKGSDGT